jgi:hypothetical protein
MTNMAKMINSGVISKLTRVSMYLKEGKIHPRTGHESLEREQMYSSTLSLTSALNGGGVVNVSPRPLYLQEREPVPIVFEAGWAGLDGCGKSHPYRGSIPGPSSL